MTLKINYLDKKKNGNKNKAFFVYSDTKLNDFKGDIDSKTNQKISNLLKFSKSLKNDKIVSFNTDIDKKIIFICVAKAKAEMDFE
jgi:hypothetical protein